MRVCISRIVVSQVAFIELMSCIYNVYNNRTTVDCIIDCCLTVHIFICSTIDPINIVETPLFMSTTTTTTTRTITTRTREASRGSKKSPLPSSTNNSDSGALNETMIEDGLERPTITEILDRFVSLYYANSSNKDAKTLSKRIIKEFNKLVNPPPPTNEDDAAYRNAYNNWLKAKKEDDSVQIVNFFGRNLVLKCFEVSSYILILKHLSP
jgi:hypothetical protein